VVCTLDYLVIKLDTIEEAMALLRKYRYSGPAQQYFGRIKARVVPASVLAWRFRVFKNADYGNIVKC